MPISKKADLLEQLEDMGFEITPFLRRRTIAQLRQLIENVRTHEVIEAMCLASRNN